MPSLFQINVAANWGSHGRIAEQLGEVVMEHGWESTIAYGRYANPSRSRLVKIGGSFGQYMHGVQSLLFDRHGMGSKGATWRLIQELETTCPDIIHLHNIHGFYLNYPLLFEYLHSIDTPVVWTLHDCWPFTGHCAAPAYAACERWQHGCFDCPLQRTAYPKSYLLDRSRQNFLLKRQCFTSVRNLHLVAVSRWLEREAHRSILKDVDIRCIYNGLDVDIFHPLSMQEHSKGRFRILGVASVWYSWKGLDAFIQLRQLLPEQYELMLVGLDERQLRQLPPGIKGITRTDSVDQLAELYAGADVYVNPSTAESFGMTTAEALACGTPVVVYDTTACPELVDGQTGRVAPLGDVQALADYVRALCEHPEKAAIRGHCRERALRLFNQRDRYQDYFSLYTTLLNHH